MRAAALWNNAADVGEGYFSSYARDRGLEVLQGGRRGLLADFRELSGVGNDSCVVAQAVRDFYEQASEYELDAWSE